MKKQRKIIPGINIQAPWSKLITSGKKQVETRSYPLPEKHKGVELAIIETGGPKRIVKKARIIGTVVFTDSFRYETEKQWRRDKKRHLVSNRDPQFAFKKDKPKYGWIVGRVTSLTNPVAAPRSRGIVFASKCHL